MSSFEQILEGSAPVDVFKAMVSAEPGLTNSELASRFVDYFERINWEAKHPIWHWGANSRWPGLTDEQVNQSLLKLLRDAGYEIKTPGA